MCFDSFGDMTQDILYVSGGSPCMTEISVWLFLRCRIEDLTRHSKIDLIWIYHKIARNLTGYISPRFMNAQPRDGERSCTEKCEVKKESDLAVARCLRWSSLTLLRFFGWKERKIGKKG